MNLVNPAQEVKVILRQNFRWDNAKYQSAPHLRARCRASAQYQYFDFENAFPGLSEFRFFDTRSLACWGRAWPS